MTTDRGPLKKADDEAERHSELPHSREWLMKALNDLGDEVKGISARLSRIEKMVWAAAGGVAILIILIGWVFRPIISAVAERILNG